MEPQSKRSGDLISWTALGSDLAGTGSPITVADPNAVRLHPTRLYRVRITAPLTSPPQTPSPEDSPLYALQDSNNRTTFQGGLDTFRRH